MKNVQDDILAASLKLGRKHDFEEEHGLQVSRLAMMLFDGLESLHGLSAHERKIFLAAAILHDVGTGVSYVKHHKHSLDLILDSELPGFSRDDMLVAANIARYHRKAEPRPGHKMFERLSAKNRERVMKLSSLLRIADSLDRGHLQCVRKIAVIKKKGMVLLNVSASGDMTPEKWAFEKKKVMFEKVFGREIKITI